VPTSYLSGSGKKAAWKPIDTAVHASQTQGFDFVNTTNEGRSWFGSDAGRLVRFRSPDGRTVTLGLQGATGGLKPVAKGSTVTYKDAVSGADLEYGVGPGRVKENITLAKRPEGPLKFTFTLDPDGLVPRARRDGSVALYGTLPHTPVMVIPAPFMTDARKADQSVFGKTYSTKVTQKLTRDGKSWKLTVTPDAKWLASKDRQYPVVIDPTITIAPSPSASQDAMVLQEAPTTNYNTSWKLSVGRTATGTARSLIKFLKKGTGNPGSADICYREGNKLFVWEVKSAGIANTGKGELAGYIERMKQDPEYKGLDIVPGFDLSMPAVGYVKETDQTVVATSHPTDKGVIVYTAANATPPPIVVPDPVQEPVKEPGPNTLDKFRDWWHRNITNHDWSNNPWTPKSPVGGPIFVPVFP